METIPIEQLALDTRDLPALRTGDAAAFERMVERHGGRLLVVARRLLGDDHEAQDALQDALISAFRGLPTFKGEARLSTWLHRITVNAVLMRMRSRRRRHEVPIESMLPAFQADGHRVVGREAWSDSAETLMERAETRASVRGAIDRLPGDYRTVLILRDIEGLDTREVAEMLDLTQGAVKVRLHRARQALRHLLEQELMPWTN